MDAEEGLEPTEGCSDAEVDPAWPDAVVAVKTAFVVAQASAETVPDRRREVLKAPDVAIAVVEDGMGVQPVDLVGHCRSAEGSHHAETQEAVHSQAARRRPVHSLGIAFHQ